jgi:excinuclease ABC subunit C
MKRYSWQPNTGDIPNSAGVYRFSQKNDEDETVLYVGKAKNLRSRLSSYFQEPDVLLARTAKMISQADSVTWTIVNSEIEALQLEHSLIQRYRPRYNIRFRDDKSYPYICVTISDEVPRIFSTRRRGVSGARYFGPYPNSSDVRVAIDLLTKVFPVRSCSPTVFRTHQRQNRACLLGHIGRCSAPCLSESDKSIHGRNVNRLVEFLDGGDKEIAEILNLEMISASNEERYEDAAKIRDQISAIETILQKSSVSIERTLSADFIAVAHTELDLILSVLQFRHGRVVGEFRVNADLIADTPIEDAVSTFILERYQNNNETPKEIYIVGVEADFDAISQVLTLSNGRKIFVSVPIRGEKARIGELASKNAKNALDTLQRSVLSDLSSRSKALKELSDQLHLSSPPLRIECVDVSHLQGTSRVAAVVVFEDGLPVPSEYRSYILNVPGDDLAGIREVISRRIERFQERKGRYPIGLLVIDGGPWQAQAAKEILDQNRLNIPVVGLAKRLEEVWFPAGTVPVMLPRDSLSLYLLQQLRDETHRRAVTHHRKRRSRAAVSSVLDEINGIGPEKRKLLLKYFGGAQKLKMASVEEIATVKGINLKLAQDIYTELHPDSEILTNLDNESS